MPNFVFELILGFICIVNTVFLICDIFKRRFRSIFSSITFAISEYHSSVFPDSLSGVNPKSDITD
jgi:hypothetical protein